MAGSPGGRGAQLTDLPSFLPRVHLCVCAQIPLPTGGSQAMIKCGGTEGRSVQLAVASKKRC